MRPSAVNQYRNLLLGRRIRHRQPQTLIQPLPNRRDPHSQRCRLLVAHVIWDLHLYISLCDGVLTESTIIDVGAVYAVAESGDAVTLFEGFGNFRADFDDSAGVVTADRRVGRAEEVDVFPVCFIRSSGLGRILEK